MNLKALSRRKIFFEFYRDSLKIVLYFDKE